jgi:hypothetical protein
MDGPGHVRSRGSTDTTPCPERASGLCARAGSSRRRAVHGRGGPNWATRLESVSIAQWAAHRGITQWAVYKARRRAELRLVAYIKATLLDADPLDDLADRVAAGIAFDRRLPDNSYGSAMSKTDADLGLQYRGKVSPVVVSSEVRPCA